MNPRNTGFTTQGPTSRPEAARMPSLVRSSGSDHREPVPYARPSLVGLVGPTAVGKSDVALLLAERLGAEVLAADSRQVYRGLDIGTAKPGPAERQRVPHHLIDLVDPHEPYSAGRYAREASACLAAVAGRGALPLLVGGTGLYLRSLLWGLCEGPPADEGFRTMCLAREGTEGRGFLYRWLIDVDPDSARVIHPHDIPKIIRALEVSVLTGTPLSAMQRSHGFARRRYHATLIGLRRDRADLYHRIDARVEQMLAAGWIDEVLAHPEDRTVQERVHGQVRELCRQFPAPANPE